MGRFLEELWWPWTRSCCFALSKENCFWWRNNQNICLFKWMVLRACTERQSPSLRLWGYSEPPINQHAGTESSVLEEMHSDLAYAYSGGITRGNIGAQIASGLWLKALHSACKCYSTEGTVRTVHCYTKCGFPASLTRLLLLFFAGDWMKSSWLLHACSIIAHPGHVSLQAHFIGITEQKQRRADDYVFPTRVAGALCLPLAAVFWFICSFPHLEYENGIEVDNC